jgi:hypothetical protein
MKIAMRLKAKKAIGFMIFPLPANITKYRIEGEDKFRRGQVMVDIGHSIRTRLHPR